MEKPGVSKANQFVWFRKWVMERQVYATLARDSKMSQSSLQRLFNHYLSNPPKNTVRSKRHVHLLIDGTYFSNGLCLILYYDRDLQYVQLYRQASKEKYKEAKEDLENIKKLGTEVYSVTCDGHKSILKSVQKVYPTAIVQRCVVHVKRQAASWLGQYPKMRQSKELLQIIRPATKLETMDEVNKWLVRFHQWHRQNEPFINEQSVMRRLEGYGIHTKTCERLVAILSMPHHIFSAISTTRKYPKQLTNWRATLHI